MRERVGPQAVPLLVEPAEPDAQDEDRDPRGDLVRRGEQHAREGRRVDEAQPLPQEREQHRTEQQLLDDRDEAGCEDEVQRECLGRPVRRGRDDERLRVDADDRRLHVGDKDRCQPKRCSRRDADTGGRRCPQPKVREPDLGPRPEQQEQRGCERAVLGGGEDRDLLRRELVEAPDRDGEDQGRADHGDVRDDEREERDEEDRPEPPARGDAVLELRDLYRRPVRRARSAASSTTWLKSEASGLGVRAKTPISATSSGIS